MIMNGLENKISQLMNKQASWLWTLLKDETKVKEN